jgi:hypothetical protein
MLSGSSRSGQLDAAISDYDSALRLDPRLANARYGRGLAKLKKGDIAGSENDLEAAERSRERSPTSSRFTASRSESVVLCGVVPENLMPSTFAITISNVGGKEYRWLN